MKPNCTGAFYTHLRFGFGILEFGLNLGFFAWFCNNGGYWNTPVGISFWGSGKAAESSHLTNHDETGWIWSTCEAQVAKTSHWAIPHPLWPWHCCCDPLTKMMKTLILFDRACVAGVLVFGFWILETGPWVFNILVFHDAIKACLADLNVGCLLRHWSGINCRPTQDFLLGFGCLLRQCSLHPPISLDEMFNRSAIRSLIEKILVFLLQLGPTFFVKMVRPSQAPVRQSQAPLRPSKAPWPYFFEMILPTLWPSKAPRIVEYERRVEALRKLSFFHVSCFCFVLCRGACAIGRSCRGTTFFFSVLFFLVPFFRVWGWDWKDRNDYGDDKRPRFFFSFFQNTCSDDKGKRCGPTEWPIYQPKAGQCFRHSLLGGCCLGHYTIQFQLHLFSNLYCIKDNCWILLTDFFVFSPLLEILVQTDVFLLDSNSCRAR